MKTSKPVITVIAPKHFLATFTKPGRIEVTVTESGQVVAFAYHGSKVDIDQDPCDSYDSLYEGEGRVWD